MSIINLIGPGSVGLCLGAALLDRGHTVNFIGRKEIRSLRIYKNSELFRSSDISFFSSDIVPPAAEWVFLCVKCHQVYKAREIILRSVNPGTKVAIVQNGVSHIEVMNSIGLSENLLPVMIDLPATRIDPASVSWSGKAALTVEDSALGAEFASLFSNTFVSVITTSDIKSQLWRKLCVNSPSGAIMCLTGRPMSVYHDEGISEIAREIIREVIQVGRKEGAALSDEIVEDQIAMFLKAAPEETNSMFDDYKAGNMTEWEFRNGVVVKLGMKHGVPTPVSNILVPLLAAQNNK